MSTSQVVRWEILPGLPGEGPPPKYFFVCHATPWAEGLVVRFWNANGTAWIGNFQGRQDWSTKVVLWPEADAVVVIAMDNFFLVNASDPDDYVTVDAHFLADDVMLGEGRTMLFVAASTTIFAYGRDRQLLWTRTALGGYDAQLIGCANGVLSIEVEEELGGTRKPIWLSIQDGVLVYRE